MNTSMRIIIIVLVVILAGGIMILKNRATDQASTSPESQREAKLPRLVDLGASACIPCKMMAPILDQLKKEYAGRMEVEFIDVWKNPAAKDRYGVRMIPTQIFYDASGRELFRHEGFYSRGNILGKWKELGIDIETQSLPG